MTSIYDKLLDKIEPWDTVTQFADWVISHNLPIALTSSTEVYESDDAMTFPIFRYNNFQAELYILYSPLAVPEHSHPFVEVVQLPIGKGDNAIKPILPNEVLKYPNSHGGGRFTGIDFSVDKRMLLITFEKWPKNTVPSTIAAVWKGKTLGPKHEGLIRRFFPNAYIKDGYADVLRNKQDE